MRIFFIVFFLLFCVVPALARDHPDALTPEEVRILDNMPEAKGLTLCNITLPNEEIAAIFMMEVDPASSFCPAVGESCPPLQAGGNWPQKVHDQLVKEGCPEALIAEKMPQILQAHCDKGFYNNCAPQ